MTTCASCGWPSKAGHDRECKLVNEGGLVRRYPPNAAELPELCMVELEADDHTPAAFVSIQGGPMANYVAIPLVSYLDLWRRAHSTGNPAPIEERLSSLEKQIATATEVAAVSAAALNRFANAVAAEQETCLECGGLGCEQENPSIQCPVCGGSGRAE